ncbi:efflux RND transporter periplasmic adaptor subunit [Rhodopirellula sallentina]|uniref:efflux RND transporter periplasmic adaptor subunit n=1 Tax=Rhodopirellula sallentina TaxID=1263869 RepID=UPI00034DA106|nr:efflux RND transporter periplasmic adaptor subunit [Rhodopirellula sallentina]
MPSVTVVPVVSKRAVIQKAGTALFQAPGWVEPRPTAIRVAALTQGVIEELLVVEGQQVRKGEPIAMLISIDAELKVEQAENLLAIREGELKRARAELDAARVRRDNPVHLEVQLSDARSMLAKAQTELAKLPYLIEASEANLAFARSSMEGKQSAKGAVPGRVIARAESDYAAAEATLRELQQRRPNLQREVDALKDKEAALQRQLKLLVEETRQLEEAEAKVQSAKALCEEARLQVRLAELALDRNIVRAPMNGRVLRLVASPGTHVAGGGTAPGQGSSTVVEMYDPERLQVRVDVRLEDVPMVIPGQPVEIETASSKAKLQGRVLQSTSSANVQKNTLEVKVELMRPPSTVSPEMLVTATFMSPEVQTSGKETQQSERLFAPKQVIESDDAGSYVWIVDSEGRSQKRQVILGGESNEGLIEVESGLRVTEKIVVDRSEPLTDGKPVLIRGDDQRIGMK